MFNLKKIASITYCLITEVTKTMVTSLLLSRLDYCNAVLAGTTKKILPRLQLVQNNAAASLIKKKRKSQPVRLPSSKSCTGYRLLNALLCALLCFKSIHGVAKRNFKFLPAKKISTLKGGFLRVKNTKDKIKIRWRSCFFQLWPQDLEFTSKWNTGY